MRSEIINIEELHNVIISFARGDFSQRIQYDPEQEERNVIAAGINMLGEELLDKTISRDYFSGIYNAISEMMIILNLKGEIQDMNDVCEKLLSINKSDFIGRPIDDLMDTSILTHVDELKKNDSKETVRFKNQTYSIPVECSLSIISNSIGNDKSILLLATDITEALLHENKLLRATIQGQENERKRISYDLHDSLGQELNGIIMYLNVLETLEPGSDSFNDTMKEIRELVQTSVHSVRTISFNLMPSILMKETLGNCIFELVRRLSTEERSKIHLHIFLEKVKFIDTNDEVLIFRIIQEFINNSLKHSMATDINVSIQKVKKDFSSIEFTLNDNGKGFDMEKVLKHNGLNSILTRLDALNTPYFLSSTPGKGTVLNFILKNKTQKEDKKENK